MKYPDVRPVPNRPFCYYVKSRSHPDQEHLVDWLGSPPHCTCKDWSYNHREYELRNSTPYLCYHFIRSREAGWDMLMEDVREQLLSK